MPSIKYQPLTNGVDHRPDSLLRRQCVQRQKRVPAYVGIRVKAACIIKLIECAGNIPVPDGVRQLEIPIAKFCASVPPGTGGGAISSRRGRTFFRLLRAVPSGCGCTEGYARNEQKGRKKCGRNTGKPRRETDRLSCGPVKIRRCTEDKSPPRSGEPDWYAKPGRFSCRQSSSCTIYFYISKAYHGKTAFSRQTCNVVMSSYEIKQKRKEIG